MSADPVDRWSTLSAACATACRRLRVEGRSGLLLEPTTPAPGRPWLFYAPCFDAWYPTERQAWIFSRLLDAGVAIAGVDVGESFGNPDGRAGFEALHGHLTGLGHAPRAVLMPQSRGGLMLYNWAVEHPEHVAGVVGIYTVCDLASYPGLDKAAGAYGLDTPGLAAALTRHNPVDRLAPLAAAGVRIWHIHGDSDTTVPLAPNSGELVRRYRSLGGRAELVVVPGYGHIEDPVFFERDEVVRAVLSMC